MLCNDFVSVIWGIDHIWQGWITPQTTTWPHTTPWTYSAVTLDIRTRSFNNVPHQWYSGPSMMMQVWIWYCIIPWVLYGACTTSDRGGSPHRPHHDHKLHPGQTQLLPWILEESRISWTMLLVSDIVVQGWWCRYGYDISSFHDCYMSYGPHLKGTDHP